MTDADEAQVLFDQGTKAIQRAVLELKDHGVGLNRRTAKMRDMRDQLRSVIAGGYQTA
jgi:hypothetical protein